MVDAKNFDDVDLENMIFIMDYHDNPLIAYAAGEIYINTLALRGKYESLLDFKKNMTYRIKNVTSENFVSKNIFSEVDAQCNTAISKAYSYALDTAASSGNVVEMHHISDSENASYDVRKKAKILLIKHYESEKDTAEILDLVELRKNDQLDEEIAKSAAVSLEKIITEKDEDFNMHSMTSFMDVISDNSKYDTNFLKEFGSLYIDRVVSNSRNDLIKLTTLPYEPVVSYAKQKLSNIASNLAKQYSI